MLCLINECAFPAYIYMSKVNNGKAKKRGEICSKFPKQTPKRCIAKLEQSSHIVLVFP